MKIIKHLIVLLISTVSFAQISIGKERVDGSALIDFKENTNKGIILPWVSETPIPEKGSLIYHVSQKKVMLFNGTQWQDLSIKSGEVNTTEIDSMIETGEGIIIGNSFKNQQGVLVLNHESQALVLPKNNKPWENIKNPEPGTISYDPKTKLICIYNGKVWTFWGI